MEPVRETASAANGHSVGISAIALYDYQVFYYYHLLQIPLKFEFENNIRAPSWFI